MYNLLKLRKAAVKAVFLNFKKRESQQGLPLGFKRY